MDIQSKSKDELWHDDFYDLVQVLEFGAKKHGAHNWLQPNGKKSSHKDMMASIFRHVAEGSVGHTKDHESGLHPLLHAACRCLMGYVRWKNGLEFYPVPSLPGVTVNTLGEVRVNGEPRKNTVTQDGYQKASCGEGVQYYVHRLVAEAFLGNAPEGYQVNHIDGNKQNNNIHNLEYVTPKENIRHAIETGLANYRCLSGEEHPNSKLTDQEVKEIRDAFSKNPLLTRKEIAEKYNVSGVCISYILNGKRRKGNMNE